MFQENEFGLDLYLFGMGKCYNYWKIYSWLINERPIYFRIYIVLGGHADFDNGNRRITMVKDHLYILPCYKPHTLIRYPEDPLDHLWIHIFTDPFLIIDDIVDIDLNSEKYRDISKIIVNQAASILDMFSTEEYSKKEYPENFRDCQVNHDIPKAYASPENIHVYHNAVGALASFIKGMILLILSGKTDNINLLKKGYVTKALQIINKKYAEEINIDMIAHELSIDPKYFIRLFRKEMGITPYHYLISLRLIIADIQIESGIPIHKAALSVGIDPKRFSTIYKKYHNHLPSAHIGKNVTNDRYSGE